MSKHRLLLLLTERRSKIILTNSLPTFELVSRLPQAVNRAKNSTPAFDVGSDLSSDLLKVELSKIDLIVLDLKTVITYREQLANWKQKVAPLFLPTLVLVPGESIGSLTVELREQIDTVINDSIDPIELDIAIALLLKTRKFSHELWQKSQAIETATQSRSKFLSMVVHEFRNPLSIISALTQLLQRSKGTLSPEKQKDLIERIQAAVIRLTKLTDGLLSFNRIASNQVTFNPQKIDIESHCRAILSDFELINQGMYKIHFHTVGDCTSAYVDAELVSTILNNLLSNALKYSPDDTPVSLILKRQREQIILEIRDTGKGIPEADLSALFDAFFRARNVGDIQGAGLGLSITKECIETHRGSIAVESEVGRGTTFTVSLPCI